MTSSTFTALLATVLLGTISHTGYAFPALTPRYPVCPKSNTITVTSTGRRSIKFAIAEISLEMQATGATKALAQKNLFSKYKKLTAYLRSQKAEKIDIRYSSIYEDYYNSDGINASPEPSTYDPQPSGYTASHSLSFEIPIAKKAVVIDGAARFGISTVDGTSFKGDPLEYKAARKLAIRDAVKRAKKEANPAAMALRKTIGKIVSMKIIGDSGQGNYYGHQGSSVGDEVVSASVTVSFDSW